MIQGPFNQNTEEIFEPLSAIQMVEPNKNLYFRTLGKIRAQETLSMAWARAVACAAILLLGTGLYFTFNHGEVLENDVSNNVCITNNNLYNE